MTDTPQTIADLLAADTAGEPETDLQAILAAVSRTRSDSSELAGVLHSLFVHTHARLETAESDDACYRQMPLNQIVALADWYLKERLEERSLIDLQYGIDHRKADIEIFDDGGDEYATQDHVLLEFETNNWRPGSARIVRRQVGPWEVAVIDEDGIVTGWNSREEWTR